MQLYSQQHLEVDLAIVQVKQKCGGLRVYTQPALLAVEELIQQAEVQARQKCERTGQPGVLCLRQGYYQTLSLQVARELEFEPVFPLTLMSAAGQ